MTISKAAYADPRFIQCLHVSAAHKELVAEFDRLSGFNLSRRGPITNVIIDDATGRTNAALSAFAEFVYENVYLRLPPEEEK